jgi:hypothetical protein
LPQFWVSGIYWRATVPKVIALSSPSESGALINNSLLNNGPRCVVCGKPVKLDSCKTNERGQALHAECAVKSTHDQHEPFYRPGL